MSGPSLKTIPTLPHFPLSAFASFGFPLITMALSAHLVSFRPVGIRACASSGDSHRRKSPSSSNWLTPLFGWSADPDYIDPETTSTATANLASESRSEKDPEARTARSRFAPGCFTAEKAKRLRMMTTSTSTFHDAMYHSAIASRLASDFKERADL